MKNTLPTFGIDLGTSSTIVTRFSPPASYDIESTPFSCNRGSGLAGKSLVIPSTIWVDTSAMVVGGVRVVDGEVLLPIANGKGYKYTIGCSPNPDCSDGPIPPKVVLIDNFKASFNEDRSYVHERGAWHCRGKIWTYYFLRTLLETLHGASSGVSSSSGCNLCVTHPSSWSSTKKACLLEILHIINPPPSVSSVWSESTAASVCYQQNYPSEDVVAVVDVGAGTTDISVLNFGDGTERVVAVRGCEMGGNEVDRVVVDWWEAKVGKKIENARAAEKVARDGKVKLCGWRVWDEGELGGLEDYVEPEPSVNLSLPGFHSAVLTREVFVELIEDKVLPKIANLVEETLRNLAVSSVILLGGGSHLPQLQETISLKAPGRYIAFGRI